MHPWKTKAIPDIGKIIYKYVHPFHHKGYIPTPINGLSLHPVEGFINNAYILGIQLIGHVMPFHPFVLFFYKNAIVLSAAGSHDGFDSPGEGNKFHQLHHELFDCNYGDTLLPMDLWLGTFKSGDDLRAMEKEKQKSQ